MHTSRSALTPALVAAVVLCALLALVALARSAQQYSSAGDVAVIESDTIQAVHGRMLLGMYSRFGWHHPGPLYFYILAPFYVLSGYRTAGLAAAALAINLASIAIMAWIASRESRGTLAVFLTAACVLFMVRFSDTATSVWNPHVLVLPTIALVVVSAAVVAGRIQVLPLVAVLASFAGQTHVGLMPTALAIPGVAVLATIVGACRERDAVERWRRWRALNWTVWTLAALWLLPIVDEWTRAPGNITALWNFFATNAGRAQRFNKAYLAWADAVTGPIRPGFSTGWGGAIAGRAAGWARAVAIAEVVLLATIAAVAWLRGRRFQSALAGLTLLAWAVALWSTTRVRGEIVDHDVFWMAGLGALGLAVVAHAIAGAPWKVPEIVTRTVCGLLLVGAAGVGVSQLRGVIEHASRPAEDEVASQALADDIQRYVRDEHVQRLLIKIDSPAWPVAAGVIVQLQKADVSFAVDDSAVGMFSDALKATGAETRAVTISAARGHADLASRAGSVAIAEQHGYFADAVPVQRP